MASTPTLPESARLSIRVGPKQLPSAPLDPVIEGLGPFCCLQSSNLAHEAGMWHGGKGKGGSLAVHVVLLGLLQCSWPPQELAEGIPAPFFGTYKE